MKRYLSQMLLALNLLLLPLLVSARDCYIMGGSFDMPTSAHIALLKKLAEKPDSSVVVMVNTAGSKLFNLSALERAHLVAAALGSDASRFRIVFQAYSKFGTIPVVLRALSLQGCDRVRYAIGADVHKDWKRLLPQFGRRLNPPRDVLYTVIPRVVPRVIPGTGQTEFVAEAIDLLDPEFEEILEGVEPSGTSSSGVRNLLAAIPADQETDLADLPDVDPPVRRFLAHEHVMRGRSSQESGFFYEYFVSRFLGLRAKLARDFPEHATVILGATLPKFNDKASLLAWDEAIVRKVVDAVVAQGRLDAYSYKFDDFPLDGRFPSSLLYFQMMERVHAGYMAFSPHNLPVDGGFTMGAAADAAAIGNSVFPQRHVANPTTAERHQLASGLFDRERRALHRRLLDQFQASLPAAQETGSPRIVFLAGAPGAGKTKILEMMRQKGDLSMPILDMDRFRASLLDADPELRDLDPNEFARKTNAEAAYLQGVAWTRMKEEKRSFIVDGTFSATEYFEGVIERMRAAGYKISIIYVTAPADQLAGRIEARARREGRGVPADKVQEALRGAEASWQRLAGRADSAVRINNPDSGQPGDAAEVMEALTLGTLEMFLPGLGDCGKFLAN